MSNPESAPPPVKPPEGAKVAKRVDDPEYQLHFGDSRYVENTRDFALPSKMPFDAQAVRRLRRLEARKHLTVYNEHTKQEPLTEEERVEYERYALAKKAEYAPRCGGIDFPFAPKGAPGSVWELPVGYATHIVSRYPECLRILPAEERPKVAPIYRPIHEATGDQFWSKVRPPAGEGIAVSFAHADLNSFVASK